MDPISYSKSAQQEQRIKKFVAEPDTASGLVTVPSVIASGETVSIPAGRTLVHPNLQVDGTLAIDGTLFIPSGGSVSTTEVDATVVKQNGSVVAIDSAVVHKTGDETIAGIKTFSSSPIVPNATTATQAIAYGQAVKNTGDETIDGVKTFSSSPIVPTPTTGDNSTKVATTAFVKSKSEADSIGVGQTWQDVTASREAVTTYTNSTGKPIMVIIHFNVNTGSQNAYSYVDSIRTGGYAANGSYSWSSTFSFIVPNGSTYSFTVSSGGIYKWSELR